MNTLHVFINSGNIYLTELPSNAINFSLCRLLRLALEEWDKDCDDLHNVHQPYIRFIKTTSREVFYLLLQFQKPIKFHIHVIVHS